MPNDLKALFKKYRQALIEEGLCVYYFCLENMEGERYSHSWRSADPMPLYSATKSMTSLAFGIAEAEGLLDKSERILDFFPEYAEIAKPGSEKIALEHLLTMSSGHRCFRLGVNDKRSVQEDWAKLFFELPLRDEPGQRFLYSNSDVYMLGRAIEIRSGESLEGYLTKRLFRPMDIYHAIWGKCPYGHNIAASKLFLMPEEFSALGHLLLHLGAYKGKALVPRSYMERASGRQIPSQSIAAFKHMAESEKNQMRHGYGYLFWLGAHQSFRADGKYGQFLAVYPEAGLVLSLLGHVEDRPYRALLLLEELMEMDFGEKSEMVFYRQKGANDEPL